MPVGVQCKIASFNHGVGGIGTAQHVYGNVAGAKLFVVGLHLQVAKHSTHHQFGCHVGVKLYVQCTVRGERLVYKA